MDDVKGMDLSHMFLMPEWAIGLSLDSKYLENTGDHFLQLSDTSTVLEELKTFYDKVTKGSMISLLYYCVTSYNKKGQSPYYRRPLYR